MVEWAICMVITYVWELTIKRGVVPTIDSQLLNVMCTMAVIFVISFRNDEVQYGGISVSIFVTALN